MNKYNNPRLLNTVVSGTGMKHPVQPHVVVGDVSNGFIRGDLMDANAIVDLVNSGDVIDQETIRQAVADVIGTAPENLDTLGEVAETLIDMQDATKQGSLAYKIAAIESELDETSPNSTIGKIKTDIQNIMSGVESSFDEVDEKFTTVNTAIQNIQQTIEDNELTIAAALNDLNNRINDMDLQSVIEQLSGVSTKLNKVYDTLMPLDFGDYLLSDLKTKVRQANITEAQKADVVGICIGQNPYTKKDVFVNVDGLTNSTTAKFYTSKKLPEGVFTTYASSEQTGTIGTNKINDEVLLNDTAKITASRDISVTSGDKIYQVNDFAGLHNTIEWAKQAKAGNGTIGQYPALQRTLGYSGITSFDDVDDSYNGWFLASTGYGVMMCPSISQKDEISLANYNSLKTAIQNLGKTWNDTSFWGSSFSYRHSGYSYVHYLFFYSGHQYWDSNLADGGYRLFALIER